MFQALDSQARHLLHAEFMVEGFDSNHNTSSILPRALIGWNRLKDEPYRYKLMVKYKIPNKSKHGVGLIGQWKLPMASKETLEPYLIKKKRYLHDEINEMASEVKKENNKTIKQSNNINFKEFGDYFEEFGEDYIKLSELYPQNSVHFLEKMAQLYKRSLNKRAERLP
jgi:hypothetical protein